MHFLPENRMCAPPFATKQRPPHLENPGSATVESFMLQSLWILKDSLQNMDSICNDSSAREVFGFTMRYISSE